MAKSTVKRVRELERSLAAACERGRLRIVQYSIQNDHLHAIVEATSQRDLASGMKAIGSRLARGRHISPASQVDPASSGRWFTGWRTGFAPPAPEEPSPVAAPHTWLLRVGWRRHGLLEPSEVPGSQ